MVKAGGDLANHGITWKKCLGEAIAKNGYSIIVPEKIHRLGRSYGVSEESYVKNGTVNLSANKMAKLDITSYKKLMSKYNPLNKKGGKLSPEDKQKLKEAEQCKKAMTKGLNKIKNVNHDDELKKTILANKDC